MHEPQEWVRPLRLYAHGIGRPARTGKEWRPQRLRRTFPLRGFVNLMEKIRVRRYLLAVVDFCQRSAFMTTTAYLTLKGQRQGDILGSVTLPNHENSILVHFYTTEIDSTRDPASGAPIGTWVHNPVVILKELDASSPLLWTSFTGNEIFVTWALAFWASSQDANGAATETQIYTIRLTNASISSIREFLPDSRDAATPDYPVQQQISFTYQKIEWIWTDGEVTAENSWQ